MQLFSIRFATSIKNVKVSVIQP